MFTKSLLSPDRDIETTSVRSAAELESHTHQCTQSFTQARMKNNGKGLYSCSGLNLFVPVKHIFFFLLKHDFILYGA